MNHLWIAVSYSLAALAGICFVGGVAVLSGWRSGFDCYDY